MKKIIGVFMFLLMVGTVCAEPMIWLTKNDFDPITADVELYYPGERVVLNGDGFAGKTMYSFDVTGQPGSCYPGVIEQGGFTTNPEGRFSFNLYTIPSDDCGEYVVHFDGVDDLYSIFQVNDEEVPEFGVVAGAAALLGALGMFLYRRK